MPLLAVLALMALPFVEVWLMIVVGGWIGVPWTLAVLVSLTVLGVFLLRRAGTRAFRDADQAMRTGEPPRGGLLDPLMLMAGGVLLVVPGFVTAFLGLLLVMPVTRPALRWAFAGWAQRRMRRMQERMNDEFAAQGVRIPGQGRPGDPFGRRPGGDPGKGGTGGSGGSGGGRVIQGQFEPERSDGPDRPQD
ncbi:FxsA family protein [Nocardiopsis sp. NRRL B-16309]|uniref:FxsA family protein n=1 Tax=Nocardiopsis sp. NRRL B-16309 TaxID=1519494 RepID=UPI0006AE0B49|nr:FxsA family protein [Nocardiopsis sp. NRRL B-16309]KOX15397.1 exlusion protein FxsA [Nocardiopsis sp. NRRL B-16309]